MIRNRSIVVAVLNWGLGHSTRSTALIRILIDQGNQVTIASDGAALVLLRNEFPNLNYIELPGYNVKYPTRSMLWNIGIQAPKIFKAIMLEKRVISAWVDQNEVEVIISDNRYGCYHNGVKNIFLGHQLNLMSPFSTIVNQIHKMCLDNFHKYWIPDYSDRKLSGDLSDSKWLDTNKEVKYIGPLSRMTNVESGKKVYDFACILSGPEPQRSYLEKLLWEQLLKLDSTSRSILVQGSDGAELRQSTSNIEVIPLANATEMASIISRSELVVCRSGYSTIMDLDKIGGRVMFVPTPGQTEQLYLANRMRNLRIANFQQQQDIDLSKAWEEKSVFTGFK